MCVYVYISVHIYIYIYNNMRYSRLCGSVSGYAIASLLRPTT